MGLRRPVRERERDRGRDDCNEFAITILTYLYFLEMAVKIFNWGVFCFSFGTQEVVLVEFLLFLFLSL